MILEKTENPHSLLKQLPFGIRGLSASSVEALYRRGLLNELELHKRMKNPHANTVQQGPRRQVGHFAGIAIHDGDIDSERWKYRLPGSTETNLISEIAELETILTRRAEKLGVDIKRGLAVTDFQQTENGVQVQSGDYSFDGKWLVGCDGARSIVRKLGGFEFAGTEPEFTGYSTRVDILDPEKLKPGRNLTATGMYMQSQPGYLIIQDFDGGDFHKADTPITVDHVQKLIRHVSNTDVTISALHTATCWTDRARQATQYRHGRILLAGDAAHIHSPLGGQGLNLGLGDAMNLGWKLAATIQGNAPADLLDSYQAERYPIGEQILNWSRAQVAVMRPDPGARALNAVMRDLISTRDGATYIAEKIWGISTHYELGDDHPLMGYSTPNFELADESNIGERLRDGKAILLDFNSRISLQTLASEYRNQINYISSTAKDSLGLSAILIRPDGIIAWACNEEADEQSLKQAIVRWFRA